MIPEQWIEEALKISPACSKFKLLQAECWAIRGDVNVIFLLYFFY